MDARTSSKIDGERVSRELSDLRVWGKSLELALAAFRIADQIPRDAAPGLTTGMRLAALSVPSCIARGRSQSTIRGFIKSLHQASAALLELKARIAVCAARGYAGDIEIRRADVRLQEVGLMVDSLMADLRGDRGVGGLGSPSNGTRAPRSGGAMRAAATIR